MFGITIADMLSLGWQYYLLIDVQANPGNIDMEILKISDTLRQIITIINILIILLAVVFFIMWFRRAYYNLHTLAWHIPTIILTIALVQRTSNFEKELLIHSETPSDSIFSENYVPPPANTESKIEIKT
jgi:hypothetical protein